MRSIRCDAIDARMTTTLSDLAALVDRQWHRHGRETPLDSLRLTRADAPSGIIRSVYRPSFCVVVQGAKTTMLGETPFRYAAGEGLLASVDLPVTARITQASTGAPYLALSVAIEPDAVADLLSAHGDDLDKVPPFAPLSVTPLDPALCDPLSRLLALLDTPRDLAALAPLIRKEIVWRLLHGPLGSALRHLGVADGHAARIRRATAHIRQCYMEPLRVADLAALGI